VNKWPTTWKWRITVTNTGSALGTPTARPMLRGCRRANQVLIFLSGADLPLEPWRCPCTHGDLQTALARTHKRKRPRLNESRDARRTALPRRPFTTTQVLIQMLGPERYGMIKKTRPVLELERPQPAVVGQSAPTIVKALGLDPNLLSAVKSEHTETLPGLPFTQP